MCPKCEAKKCERKKCEKQDKKCEKFERCEKLDKCEKVEKCEKIEKIEKCEKVEKKYENREECGVEVSKRLIYLSADQPSELAFSLKAEAVVSDIPLVNADLDLGVAGELDIVKIISNASFAYAITVTNNNCYDIVITSLYDPLFLVNNICGNCCNFINFECPVYSDRCVSLNRCFKKNGELIGCDKINLCPGAVGTFVVRGCLNTRKLQINNFVVLKYKKCGSDRQYVIKSKEESLCLVNNFEADINEKTLTIDPLENTPETD